MAYVKIEMPVVKNRHVLYCPGGYDVKLEAGQDQVIEWYKDHNYTNAEGQMITVPESGEYRVTLLQWEAPKEIDAVCFTCFAVSSQFESRHWKEKEYSKTTWTICCFEDLEFYICVRNKTTVNTTIRLPKCILLYELIT